MCGEPEVGDAAASRARGERTMRRLMSTRRRGADSLLPLSLCWIPNSETASSNASVEQRAVESTAALAFALERRTADLQWLLLLLFSLCPCKLETPICSADKSLSLISALL